MSGGLGRSDSAVLASALGRLTSETLEQQRERDANQLPVEPTDMVQQVHLNLKGTVGEKPLYQEVNAHWPYPFMMKVASGQQDSTLDKPTFCTGVELRSDSHVLIDAQVVGWIEDDSELITGARIRVAVWSPTAPRLVDYDGTIHMTFTGYAATAEDDDTDSTTTSTEETP